VRAAARNSRVLEGLDREKLLHLAKEWVHPDQAFLFSRVCSSMNWWDEDCMLDMAERYVPAAQSVLQHDVVEGFRDLDDILMHVLRIYDPLGVYVGQLRPGKRRWAIARAMCATLDPSSIASQISKTRRRDY